ncbi:MAG TPA: putative metalloprotease CJM1_0395 family protein [Geothrix sp.]|nr:putative metalloprotease CJM1_0395 family protein [Geothrix sp.]
MSSLTGASFPSLFGPADAARARVIAELRAADQRVRAHEAAHKAVGGDLIQGGASFTYVRGPDGRSYAVAGEVSIDTSPVPGKPAATLAKAQQIQAAALAPADPSPQDRSVAAAAAAMAAQAQRDLQRTQAANQTGQNLDLTG